MKPLIKLTTTEVISRRSQPVNFKNLLEVHIDGNDLLPVAFLEAAVQRSKTVSFIKLPNGGATGFLISNDLLLTNNHVFPDRETADKAEINFNYEDDIYGNPKPYSVYFCNTDEFFYTNVALDYSVVKVNKIIQDGIYQKSLPGEIQGFTPLSSKSSVKLTNNLNIIQHPGMRRKEIAIRNNTLQSNNQTNNNFMLYTSDTEPGASGSPIYNDKWELVGLHHSAGQKANSKFINNEGISIFSIINDMLSTFSSISNGTEILHQLGINGINRIEVSTTKTSFTPYESGSVSGTVTTDGRGNTGGSITGTWHF